MLCVAAKPSPDPGEERTQRERKIVWFRVAPWQPAPTWFVTFENDAIERDVYGHLISLRINYTITP